MSKQAHDTGRQKRNRERPTPPGEQINGQKYACELVERGLADPAILGQLRPTKRRTATQQHTDTPRKQPKEDQPCL